MSDKPNEMDEFSFDWIRLSVREGPPGVFSSKLISSPVFETFRVEADHGVRQQ